jgi:undecaprenyl-diphosphatase
MGISAIDLQVMTWVSQHRSAFLDGFFVAVTWAGSLFVLLPLSILMMGYLFACDKKEALGILGLGFGGAVMLTYLLKAIIQRPRPEVLAPLTAIPADFSFPSAHTTQITAFCLCLILIFGPGRWSLGFGALCLAMVMLIGCVAYSRLYLQVHFASDVVAGLLLPVIWVSGMVFMLRRF